MACEQEQQNLALAAADLALAMGSEAAAYSEYMLAVITTYISQLNYESALIQYEECQANQNRQMAPMNDRLDELQSQHLAERMDCVTHGMNLIDKIKTSGAVSKELTAAVEKLQETIRKAI
jgi:hypothetical protein